MMIFW